MFDDNTYLNSKGLYTFCSAKKLYFTRFSKKCLLYERLDEGNRKTLSLTSRATVVTNKENGITIFPKNKMTNR